MRTLVCLLFVASALAERFYYDGYKVFDLYAETLEELDFLNRLMLNDPQLDFWDEPNRLGQSTVMVAPEYQEMFLSILEGHDIKVEVKREDVGVGLRQFWADLDSRRSSRALGERNIDLDDFNELEDINAWLLALPDGLCADAGLTCEITNIGKTVEDRDMYSLRVATGSEDKKSFWIDSTIHAREWLAPATTLKILNHLVTSYGSDDEVNNLLDSYDWFFVIMVNPDGYAFSWSNNRYWRKNRQSPPSGTCYGVDLNRNHEHNWGQEGVSTNPCSDIYCGTGGASEPEVQNLQNEIARVHALNEILVLMTFHSYGYYWMHPWGNTINFAGQTCERADDHDEMFALADITADAIQSTHSTTWRRGSSCEVIYATTGGTNDWAKAVPGIKHAICPELRGSDFVIAPSNIQPSFEEIWAGLVAQEAALSSQ
jgi:carboxypeptidase A2